ncbi:hypothetical protein AB0P17_24715 [Streptomyces sp. NPDC088124]|uniref:effector-associated constant component EACC1 n=1 Tax=Streptomyces sp. NPDC088124 TaxID=3154654 RepID=UPI003446ED62
MATEIRIYGASGEKVPDGLRVFLKRAPEMREVGSVRRDGKVDEGMLGDGLDWLTLTVTTLLGLPATFQVIRNYIDSRGGVRAGGFRLQVGDTSITITGAEDDAEIRRLISLLRSAAADDEDGDGSQ